MADAPLSFRVGEWFLITGRGWTATVKPSTDLQPLVLPEREEGYDVVLGLRHGDPIRLDCEDYVVRGIERFCVAHWWRLGFGVLIDGQPKNRLDLERAAEGKSDVR